MRALADADDKPSIGLLHCWTENNLVVETSGSSGNLHHCGKSATVKHMSSVASRDLRNHTADVLRRVAGGDRVTITVNGAPVAELIPPSSSRRASISREDLILLLARHQADAGLRSDLEALTDETTDELDPL